MDFNPNYPEVLGLEWFTTQRQTTRVWTGAPARMQRFTSTAAETIEAIKLSATIDPNLRADARTLIDVYEEGDHDTVPEFTAVDMSPNSDDLVGNWTTNTGATTNLFQAIDDPATRWPNPGTTESTWIENRTNADSYFCTVDASSFASGGAYENGRIGFVEIKAIFAANTGFRKLRCGIEIDGVNYQPNGSNLRDVNGYGGTFSLWFGELNPHTELPWTPADLADFDIGGNSIIVVRSQTANASAHPRVHAIQLRAWASTTETRKAIGVLHKSENLFQSQVDLTTDALLTYPAATADWAKADATNYVLYWRQAVCPALYGPVIADDLRWNGAWQELHDSAQPRGAVYPLSDVNDTSDPPTTGLASQPVAHHNNGRPVETDTVIFNQRMGYGFALIDDSAAPSVDSQPYRHDLDTLHFLRNTEAIGQRVTMPSTQSYLAVRFPIIPPSTGLGSVTATVHNASTGTQVGGSYAISVANVRALPATSGGVRYVSGLLSSAASLTSGVQYEIRLTVTGPNPWLAFTPDAALAPEASFGGVTDCLRTGSTSVTDRDLCITLIKQPDAPTAVTLSSEVVAIANPDGTTRDVEHVEVSWTAPAVPLGAAFTRYEMERQVAGESTWTRVANFATEATTSWVDHLVPRGIEVAYRIRSIAKDGRFSAWAESNTFTPSDGDYSIVLTSNHVPGLEVAFDQDLEARFEFRGDANAEVLQLHGADYQVVFEETENRGVGFSAGIEVNFSNEPPVGQGGEHVFDALRALIRSTDTPHVAFLDWQGVKKLGHVIISDATQTLPGHVYKATLQVIPTHDEEIPVEVP